MNIYSDYFQEACSDYYNAMYESQYDEYEGPTEQELADWEKENDENRTPPKTKQDKEFVLDEIPF